MNPNPRRDCGTSMHQIKDENKDYSLAKLPAKSKCYKDGNCEEFEKEIQKNTDESIKKIDKILADKEKEILNL